MSGCLFILTGGTIDAQPYEATPANVTPLSESLVPAAVRALGLEQGCSFRPWKMKDSKEFTDGDMRELAQLVAQSAQDAVIITHGTDHMPQNSRRLAQLLAGTPKRVIFTGAMEPLSHGATSDGPENLKTALTGWASQPPGVHVVMHGEWFSPLGLRKDFEAKRFYAAQEKTANADRGR